MFDGLSQEVRVIQDHGHIDVSDVLEFSVVQEWDLVDLVRASLTTADRFLREALFDT